MNKGNLKIILLLVFCLSIPLLLSINKPSFSTELPPMSEIRELSDAELTPVLENVRTIILDTPTEDIFALFKKNIENTLNTQTALEIDKFVIDISEDSLLMDEPENKKLFNAIFIKLTIHYDTAKLQGDEEKITNELMQKIFDSLNEDTYGFYKLKTIEANFFDMNMTKRYEYANSKNSFNKIMTVNQSEQDLKIQTFVYDFVQSLESEFKMQNPNQNAGSTPGRHQNLRSTVLKRFGIIDDTKELYVEIGIHEIDDYSNVSTYTQKLQGISEDLHNAITQNVEHLKYLKEHGVTTITASFYTPWGAEQYKTYNHNLTQ